jgi:acylphosphatase
MRKVRAHVLVEGRVQGVFFRACTQDEARKCNVTGWVRNRFDGKVEALFEGDEDNVATVLRWCNSGPPSARVNKVTVNWEPHIGEFSEFSITR